MKFAAIAIAAVAGIAASIRWTPLGARVRGRWSTVVRTEKPR